MEAEEKAMEAEAAQQQQQGEDAELSAEAAELAAKQAEAAAKEKIIADALKQGDAEMAAIDAMGEEDLLANLDADELAALEAELAELEG
ncbi:hypothetical protein OEZ86_012557 [Tetradesmus obliquus]|uniref:Uncharacterized protein n=1 Tax=Tetradesmus obliquus TaxID=3088 RepID=A0ABY8TYF7_TETOB|nr:hypothetical protein OEZ85_002594 [Tetradesmus obliquus]WIA34201.1 hypothetical protein OEZ86_012557 [Tetradesmus obliquus]